MCECELLCNSSCYIVTVCPFSGLCENPTWGRSWFFTLDGLKIFHVKIVCFVFISFRKVFAICYVAKQSVRTGAAAVCEKLAKNFKNTIHPLSCAFVLTYSTSGIREGSFATD